MKKNMKKAIALTLATSMTVATPIVAGAADIDLNIEEITPYVELTFDGTTSGTTYTEDDVAFTLFGDASVVADPDDSANQVLALSPSLSSTASSQGAGYISSPLGAYSSELLMLFNSSQAVTVSMKVRPTMQNSDWNYLFKLGYGKDEDTAIGYCYLDGTTGLIQRMDAGESYQPYYPGDGWVDGNPLNSEYNYFNKYANANHWYTLTYVYTSTGVSIYVDGQLTTQHTSSYTDFSSVLMGAANGSLTIGAGADLGDGNCFTGYVDDFQIYANALDADDLSYIVDTNGTEESLNPVALPTGDTVLADEVRNGAFFTNFSSYYSFSGDFTASFDMTIQDSGQHTTVDGVDQESNANYYSPLAVVTSDADRGDTGYSEYLVMRSDNWAWGSAFNEGTPTFIREANALEYNGWVDADSANGASASSDPATDIYGQYDGARVEYVVSRAGDCVKVLEKITPSGSTESYDQYTIIKVTAEEDIRVFFASEYCSYIINSASYTRASDITGYRGSDVNSGKDYYTAPTKSGYVFAGWYQDANYEEAVSSSTVSGTAYPKFVEDEVLTIKAQVTAETTATSESTNLRVITGVDTLNYSKIMIHVSASLASGKVIDKSITTSRVYTQVRTPSGLVDVSEVFGSPVAYATSVVLSNIQQADFSTNFTITPSVVTLDGTTVTGTTRVLTPSEGF